MTTDGSWLPADAARAECRVAAGSPDEAAVERARLAAAAYVERARPDLATLVGTGDTAVVAYAAPADVVAGALMLTSRLYARRSSPVGLASYGDLGVASVVRLDPDLERLLGIGRHAAPRIG